MDQRKLIAIGAVCYAFCTANVARADFVGGVENFAGTSLDLTTWQAFPSPPVAPILEQNDGLTIRGGSNHPPHADYTTQNLTVGIGQSVRVTLRTPSQDGHHYLWLTTNNHGSSMATVWDSRLIGIDAYSLGIVALQGGDGTAHGEFLSHDALTINTIYMLQIDRLSQTTARFSVRSANGTELFGLTRTGLTNLPANLFVSIGNAGSSTTFLSVVVPETAGSAILMLLAASSVRRTRTRVLPSNNYRHRTSSPSDMPISRRFVSMSFRNRMPSV